MDTREYSLFVPVPAGFRMCVRLRVPADLPHAGSGTAIADGSVSMAASNSGWQDTIHFGRSTSGQQITTSALSSQAATATAK